MTPIQGLLKSGRIPPSDHERGLLKETLYHELNMGITGSLNIERTMGIHTMIKIREKIYNRISITMNIMTKVSL